MKKWIAVFICMIVCSSFVCADFDFSQIKNKISEFTLANGLKFILLEDHSVPIATFVTYVNAGGSDERTGIWGVSHVLEHMAFKGTSEIGTTNVVEERKVLAKMDDVFERILAERDSLNPDQEKIKALDAELKKLGEEAGKYIINDDFNAILKRNGMTGLNAGTSKDYTQYFFSLPSNRVELWAYMESARFSDPVFREFYKERDVIKEERRMRAENQPIGKLIEELQGIAYKDHPYGTSVIGPMSNLSHLRRSEVENYFRTNYTARNMVVGVAGDVTPEQLKKLAEKYFSKIPAGKKNNPVFSEEPKQLGEKTVTIYEDTQPWLVIGYHSPAASHPDFIKFSLLDLVLTSGRSSRLNKKMIIEDKSAMALFSFNGFPGDKYPGLYMMLFLPNQGFKTNDLLAVVDKEIEKIARESITEEELASAKTRAKYQIIDGMSSNQGLLFNILEAEVKLGSWQKAFDDFAKIDQITTKDIQELVKTYLVPNNRNIAKIEKLEAKQEEVKK